MKHFHFSSHICLIDKRNHEKSGTTKHVKLKKQKQKNKEYNITSTILICTSIIVSYSIVIGKRQKS